MTGRTRDYLADLANQKGVRFPGKEGFPQDWASRKIEELKNTPDAEFEELNDAQKQEIEKDVKKIQKGLLAWTFTK